MSRNCPRCSDPLSQWGVCGSCGFGKKAGLGPVVPDMERERNDELVAAVRREAQATAPTSFDLTDQQWVAVCKFFPFVAEHCKRARATSDHPLWSKVQQGPMFRRRRLFDPESVAEREAIQADA